MIIEFWDRFASSLEKFGPTGVMVNGGRIDNGYGYLIEGFARLTPQLPQNTPAASAVADALMQRLQAEWATCPDLLFLRLRGTRVSICGMAEVKSSAVALDRKPLQLLNQEYDLRKILRKIQGEGSRHVAGSLAWRKFRVEQPLRKILVLPLGVSEDVSRKLLPFGWEKLELEITADELIFVGKQIWPRFRPDVVFEVNARADFEDSFMRRLEERASVIFRQVFPDLRPLEVRDLMLFVLATGKLPAHDALLHFVLDQVMEMGFHLPLPMVGLSQGELTPEEHLRCDKLNLIFRQQQQRDFIPYFLARLRDFKARLTSWLQKKSVQKVFRPVATPEGGRVEVTIPLDILDV